jgi:GT2 family glycosyltransferase
VFIADNASNQPPPDEIFSLLPGMVFVQNERNDGFAKANNNLLQQATDSKWVVLLNPDAFPEPDWLEQLIKAARDYPEYQSFSSRLLQAGNPALLDGEGDCYHISGVAWRKGFGKQADNIQVPTGVFSPCAAAAMYRSDILLEVGGFDEEFFCYVEDVDLGFRLRLAGYKAMYVPDAVVHHIGSATTGGQQSDFSVYHGHRNLVWTFIKNMPGGLFWLLLPLHLVMNLSSIVWFTLRGKGKVILRAKRDAIKGIPRMWRKRRGIQASRHASVADIWNALDKHLMPFRR